jgi:hypothetical protein
VFVVANGRTTLERMAADQRVDELFLKLLDRFNAQDRNVCDKAGRAYAPAVFANEPEAKANRVGRRGFAEAMTRLFAANKIHLEAYGFPSRKTFGLARGPKP